MANTVTTLNPGQIVNDTYRVVRLLGQGGMGAVFAAEHLRLPGKRVAVKVLHPSYSAGEVLLRFKREAEIASRIGHPNIVEVMDFNTLPDGAPYLVMELLTGESLAARLKRGPLTEAAALSITRQIASALFAAHRQQVVHRDLKPDNVFLCPRDVEGEIRDHVKVLDFGISKIRGSQTVVTQDAAVMGTPHYMSPEQATGKNQEIDQRTDIFALGAILYEMLSGKIAFPGDNFPAVIYRVVFEPHPPLRPLAPQVSPRVLSAVDKALAKKVDERFGDMNEFIFALTGKTLGGSLHAFPTEGGIGIGTMDTLAPSAQVSGLEATVAPAIVGAPTPHLPPAHTAPSVPPPVVASHNGVSPPPAQKKRTILFLAMVTAVAAAGIGAFVLLRKPAMPPVAVDTVVPRSVTPPTEPTSMPMHMAMPLAAVDASSPPVAMPTPFPSTSTEAPDATTSVRKSPSKEKAEALSPAVVAELDEAAAALSAKNPKEAIRLARHSLYSQKSARAFAIITQSMCLQGDLGGAKAAFRNVAGPLRGKVLKECKSLGLSL